MVVGLFIFCMKVSVFLGEFIGVVSVRKWFFLMFCLCW